MSRIFQVNDSHNIKYYLLESERDIYNTASEILKLIQLNYESEILNSIINRQYPYFSKNEQMFLVGECKKNIPDTEIYNNIITQLCEFIREENMLNVSGFINFRLREYVKSLETAAENAVTDYVNNCEYEKLIKGLIMYIDYQQPLIDNIEIVSSEDSYIINDCKGNNILTLYYFDDVLLDVMLTLAPNRIVIKDYKFFKNKELLDTICKIFKDRVILIHFDDIYKEITSKVDKE